MQSSRVASGSILMIICLQVRYMPLGARDVMETNVRGEEAMLWSSCFFLQKGLLRPFSLFSLFLPKSVSLFTFASVGDIFIWEILIIVFYILQA